MPVAEFPGRFGWGYDGVDLYRAVAALRTPRTTCARFVDRAHALGLGVILDVVYNHLGPDGNYLTEFAPQYFTARYATEWGEPINFDGEDAGPVREFFVANAAYWMTEFHLDGLRLDATQAIFDASPEHVIAAVARRTRQAAGRAASSSSPRTSRSMRAWSGPASEGGYGLDALWNDDFHHTAMVAMTGRREAYYSDYARHRRRSSSRAPSTGSCTRGSRTRGRASAVARPRAGCTAGALRRLPPEPRSGRQLGRRPADPRSSRARAGSAP